MPDEGKQIITPRTPRSDGNTFFASTPNVKQNNASDHSYSNIFNNNSVNGLEKPTARAQLNSDSSYSIDVLSGGESESGSLRKTKPGQVDTLDRLIKPRIMSNGNEEYPLSGSESVENKIKPHAIDKILFIAKELLMTERTYKKDLDVIINLLRKDITLDAAKVWSTDFIWRPLEAISAHQMSLLHALETKLGARTLQSENNNKDRKIAQMDVHSIGQVLFECLHESLPWYEKWINEHLDYLMKLEQYCTESPSLERLFKEIETNQKACYLPLYTFILKPLYRLLHYKLLLERSIEVYSNEDADYETVKGCLSYIQELCSRVREILPVSLNYIYLCLLRRDVDGLDNLVNCERKFLRQGCLYKYTSKGPQQRMFFLFSDILVYSNKGSSSQQQFKVHGILPVQDIQIEEAEYTNSFSIYGGGRAMTLSANTSAEKEAWMSELERASHCTLNGSRDQMMLRNMATSSSAEELSENSEPIVTAVQRNNTLAHVCWHRNTSLSCNHLGVAMENQLSGYLLRKFKNSQGWQRLWVVFASFCLYFYKTYHDEYPLASLPLLGYTITKPNERDGINKEFVFKLVFKNHVYFFRAESEYTFGRWMEVISCATMQPTD